MTDKAHSEARNITRAALQYTASIKINGPSHTRTMIAYRDLNKALRAHGIDSTTEAIEATEADLLADADWSHSAEALLPDDLLETRQHLMATGGMGV